MTLDSHGGRGPALQLDEGVQVADQWVNIGPQRIFLRSWKPQGHASLAPILMFHDSLGCVELWKDLPSQIAQATGREVIAYDRPGFGRSDPRADLPALTFVEDEAEEVFPHLVQHLNTERVVLLGHSVGGAMAIQCASKFPARCEALVTISSQVFAEETTLEGIRAARETFKNPEQVAKVARYHGTKARWVLDAWIENWLSPGFATWSIIPTLPSLRCPVLAIHGDADEYGSVRHANLIAEGCTSGGATACILSGYGHLPHRENPSLIVQSIASFLARRPRQGAATQR